LKLVSNAVTLEGFREDMIQYLELRAEQNRSMEKCVRSKAACKMYLHAASEIQSIADDLRFLVLTSNLSN